VENLAGMAAHAARRVERLKAEQPAAALRALAGYARVPRDFAPALSGVVRDLRFAEPGRGLLVAGGEVTAEYAARRAASALSRGAAGLGVWTERNFHAGDYPHLDAVRAALPDALLAMLDCVVDAWQLERARAGGADAVLLIPGLLGPRLEGMLLGARDLGLTPIAWDDGAPPRPL
jgi:indole-3-glycerol phosphate synthase